MSAEATSGCGVSSTALLGGTLKTLLEMRRVETRRFQKHCDEYVKAAGRDGARLVRSGLAKRLGVLTIDSGFRAVCYELTDAGRRLADSHLQPNAQVKRRAKPVRLNALLGHALHGIAKPLATLGYCLTD